MKSFTTKIFCTGLALATCTTAFAQKSDAKSRQILDAVSANYKSKKNTYFKFIYGTGNGKVTKNETGIFYATPSQYRLKIMGTEQIFDGSKVYSISDEDKEVTVAKASAGLQTFSPLNYLDSYKKDFDAAYEGKKTVNGISADFIKLTPVKKSSLEGVYIFVDSAKKRLLKVEQYSTNKDVAVISVQDYRENQAIPPQTFTFDKAKYKNYIITEL